MRGMDIENLAPNDKARDNRRLPVQPFTIYVLSPPSLYVPSRNKWEPRAVGAIKQRTPMNTSTQTNPLVLEGNFYQDGKIVGPVLSAVLLPLDRSHPAELADSADDRVRYLITIRGFFTVHDALGTSIFEVDSGRQRMRVFPEDSAATGHETGITVTLEQ
jgi:hypothetical protein